MWVGGQRHALTDLPPVKTRCLLYRRLGWAPGRVGKISPPPGFDPRTVPPVASRYTDYAIPAHTIYSTYILCDMVNLVALVPSCNPL